MMLVTVTEPSGITFLQTVITSLISAITVIVSIWYKEYYIANKVKGKNNLSDTDKSMFYLEMDKTCSTIRETLSADGSYLAYFHNGGMFSNKINMDKFTVVGEDYNELICNVSYKKAYTSSMINYMSYTYHRLLVDNKRFCPAVEDMVDLSFKNDLCTRYVKSIYLFLIKDPTNDKPVGFFALEYTTSHELSKNDETEVYKYQNKLSRLLNMTVLQ